MERRIADDPRLAAERDRIQALQRAMRRLPRTAVPPAGLRQRIEAMFGLRQPSRPTWSALAASVAVAVMVSAGSVALLMAPASDGAIGDVLLNGHVRAMMAAQTTDVASSDRHTVKPWFNGRIAYAPRVRRSRQRRLPADRRPSRCGRPRAGRHTGLSAAATFGQPDQVPGENVGASTVRRSSGGYQQVGWTEDGVTYWAVSDLGAPDLENFARLFRTTPPDRE